MPRQTITRSVEFKLYPSAAQSATLDSWLHKCCWLYNRCLEQRIKAYKRRKQSVSYYDQQAMLTVWRGRMERLRAMPVGFARGALRRIERGFQAFFRRVKAGEKKVGFPRFRAHHRYNSIEQLAFANYLRADHIYVPGLGLIRCRGIEQDTTGKQLLLRVIRRSSGWYAQIVFEREVVVPSRAKGPTVGIDVGLNTFAALSNGEVIDNPRFARRSEAKLHRLQRRLSRKSKGSCNRRKAVRHVARHHERVAAQRRNFANQESRKLVNRFGKIAYEDLNIKGLARTRMAKSIMDAAWGQFIRFIVYKAACAGKRTIAVDPRGTSQTCPDCGAVKKKSLSERMHCCPACGLIIDRDFAAACVIRARAAGVAAALIPVEGSASTMARKRRGKSARRNRKDSTPC